MGQQLRIKVKRQRRKSWIKRKKKAEKAKAARPAKTSEPKPTDAKAENPATPAVS